MPLVNQSALLAVEPVLRCEALATAITIFREVGWFKTILVTTVVVPFLPR
jgi:hypothetical protein